MFKAIYVRGPKTSLQIVRGRNPQPQDIPNSQMIPPEDPRIAAGSTNRTLDQRSVFKWTVGERGKG